MTKDNYREIYLILNKLGANYIEKIPKQIYNHIIQNMSTSNTQNSTISKDAVAFIAGLHYRYWAESQEEKTKLIGIFKENQKIKDGKTNPENLLKNTKKISYEAEKQQEENVQLIKVEKWYKKILGFFKRIFRIGGKNC